MLPYYIHRIPRHTRRSYNYNPESARGDSFFLSLLWICPVQNDCRGKSRVADTIFSTGMVT